MMKRAAIVKSILAATILSLLTPVVTAQPAVLKKGNKMIQVSAGDITISNSKTESTSAGVAGSSSKRSGFSIGIYPAVGFFLSDNFVVGSRINIAFSNSKGSGNNTAGVKTSENSYNSFTIGLTPFARYYFGVKQERKSAFYVQAGGGFNTDVAVDEDYTYYNNNGTFNSKYVYAYTKKPFRITAEATVGWNRFVTDYVALNADLGYRYSRNTYAYKYTLTPAAGSPTVSPEAGYTTTGSNIVWSIGVNVFLPGKAGK